MFRDEEEMQILHLPEEDDVEALLQWYEKAEEFRFDLELKLEEAKERLASENIYM